LRVNVNPHKFILVKHEELAVSRQAAQKFDMERFSLENLIMLEVREWYQL
jgi:hypothetical protein